MTDESITEQIKQARKELKQLREATEQLRIQKETTSAQIYTLKGLLGTYERKYNSNLGKRAILQSKLNNLEAQQRNSYE